MARLCPDSLSIREHREFREWVSFGWDKNNRKSVDAATFFSYEPFEGPALDRIVDENLRQGKYVELSEKENG